MCAKRDAIRRCKRQGLLTLGPVIGEEFRDFVQKGQTLALGELKGVRKTEGSEKGWEVMLLEEAGVCS